MITLADFRLKFPEFTAIADSTIESAIASVAVESNSYEGLALYPTVQAQAQSLHVAAYLVFTQQESGAKGAISSVKSRNDAIGYAVNPVDAFSLESTQYGRRLIKLLETFYP